MLCMLELQADVGEQVLLCSVLQRETASRTSQGLAELPHENKKVESWSTSRQLVYLLGLLFVFRTVQIPPLFEREKEEKKECH